MATPTNSQRVSTPMNPLVSTPNRPTASPRPNTGAFSNRPFAYKSPAVKTPASTHGHSHRISVSSQPTSTPMAAPALPDGLLNLDSPATALMASMGQTGLTPLPSGHDGLGITTGITPSSMRDLPAPRNPEAERLHKAQEVVRLLKTRIAGRGITRQGVERLAQIEGFTILWDDDNLTVAGNSVDLEIAFDDVEQDTVKDVILKLNTSETEESQLQRQGSAILKRHLTGPSDNPQDGPWRSPEEFAADLQYLGRHDRLESSANGFELVDDLYQTFRKIWSDEKKRMRDRHEAHHICQGNVGRPVKDDGDRLGLSTRYWVNKHEFVASSKDESLFDTQRSDPWIASFSCEQGQPSITADRDWLASEPLNSSVTTENLFQEGQIEKPNWQGPTSTLHSGDAPDGEVLDPMAIDKQNDADPKSLNVRFVCQLDPTVLLPINMVTELNSRHPMIHIDETKILLYQDALQHRPSQSADMHPNELGSTRRSRTIQVFDDAGQQRTHEHAYALFSQSAWSLPVAQMRFTHPQYFAEALPILRQYALVWSLLRNTTADSLTRQAAGGSAEAGTSLSNQQQANGIIRRSNKKTVQSQLESMLDGRQGARRVLNVDISIDLVSDTTKTRLSVIVPVQESTFLQISIEVKRGGLLEVVSISGVPSSVGDKLEDKATKILSLSEDIGVLVEWLVMKCRKSSKSHTALDNTT